MGYDERLIASSCKGCNSRWLWRRKPGDRPLKAWWTCQKCSGQNQFGALPEWPEIPRSIYVGANNSRLLKLYPVPPEQSDEAWARPYGVRSFIYQASRAFGGCRYSCASRGRIYDENIFSDRCTNPDDPSFEPESWDCHVLAGWSAGKSSCLLFDEISKLCQTDIECKFLGTYLRYVKDRDFPMLIPQVRIGIAERRRPDFVLYVPLQYWRFKWLAVELDGAHREEKAPDDAARDRYYAENGYEVISLRPGAKGYLEEVKALAERVEVIMNLSKTDEWEVALEATVTRFKPAEDIPF